MQARSQRTQDFEKGQDLAYCLLTYLHDRIMKDEKSGSGDWCQSNNDENSDVVQMFSELRAVRWIPMVHKDKKWEMLPWGGDKFSTLLKTDTDSCYNISCKEFVGFVRPLVSVRDPKLTTYYVNNEQKSFKVLEHKMGIRQEKEAKADNLLEESLSELIEFYHQTEKLLERERTQNPPNNSGQFDGYQWFTKIKMGDAPMGRR